MILTDIPSKTKELLGYRPYGKLAKELGISRQAARMTAIGMKGYLAQSVVEFIEALGYDIEIEFVRR